MNPGLEALIQQSVQDALSDPSSLPSEFWDYAGQHSALNPVPVQATTSPTIIASGVGSSSNTPTRYVGGTTSGAPTSGTYVAGDFVVSHDGHVYICTATGTPGTWSTWPAQGEIAYNQITSNVTVSSTSSASPTTVIAGTSVTYTGVPVYIEVFSSAIQIQTTSGLNLGIWDGSTPVGLIGHMVGVNSTLDTIWPFYSQVKVTPTAGSHNYSLAGYLQAGSPGAAFIGAGAGGSATTNSPAFIRVRYA